jgi:hypothetical protein
MPSAFCTLQKWCRRPNLHNGPCRKKPSRKELEKLLRDGLMTPAERELWKTLGGDK